MHKLDLAPINATIPDARGRILVAQTLEAVLSVLRPHDARGAGAVAVDNPVAGHVESTTVVGSHHTVARDLREWAAERMTPATIAYVVNTGERHVVGQAPARCLIFCVSSWGSVDRVWTCALPSDLGLGPLEPATPGTMFAPVPIGSLN